MHTLKKVFLLTSFYTYILTCVKLAEGVDHYVDLNNLILLQESFSEGSSYFGFSIALWKDTNSAGNRSWVLVGAPKGNYSDTSTNKDWLEPGVLWRCSLGVGDEDTCEILPIDPSKAGGRDCRPDRCPNESKNNSWLGQTITSIANDRLVICAPQWKREEHPLRGTYKFNGLCYWLPDRVIQSHPFEMRSMIRDGFTSQRLFPFVDPRMQTISRFPVWANGEVGFSSHLAPDGELFLGAVGVNGWNGSIVRYKDDWRDGSLELERGNRNGRPEFSQFSVLRTELIEHFHHLEYFGYAVTTGIFMRERYEFRPRRLVAAGAPRGGLMKGIVLVFHYPENPAWLPEIFVEGNQFGSYFGSVLSAVDLNGDGMDELLVGSPLQNTNLALEVKPGSTNESLFDDKHDSSHKLKVGDQGCVFVYTSKMELYTFGEPWMLCGTKQAGSKFGSVIASLGDINGDGFNDLAIAAPFENEGEGVVYIYNGGPKFGLDRDSSEYYLKISPSVLKIKLINFGISIVGELDLDGNKTPDFAIGSHASQTVVIIRTRPSVKFEGRIDVYLNETDAEKLPMETTDFTIRSCNRILKGPQHEAFDLNIKLSLDERFQIIRSLEGISYKTQGNFTIEYNIQLKLNQTICLEWLAQTTDEFQPDLSHPKPLTISQVLVYEEEFHDVEADLIRRHVIIRNEFGQPELNISGPSFEDFCSHCPPRTTLTTLFHLPIAADNCMDDGDPICRPELEISLIHRDGGTSFSDKFIIGSGNLYTLRLQISNADTAETIYFPVVDIFWLSPPLPEVTSDCKLNLTEIVNKTSTDVSLQCDLGYTIQRNESKQVEVRLYMHGMYAKKRREELNFQVSVYPSKEINANKTNQKLDLILAANVEVFIMGSSENVTFLNDTYTNLTQTFRISLLGESPVESIRSTFWFPVKGVGRKENQFIFISQPEGGTCWGTSKSGNFQLETYRNEYQPISSAIGTRQSLTSEFDGSNQKNVNASATRRKIVPPSKDHFKKSSKDNFQLRCKNGDDTNCLQVECEATNIVPNHNIMLEFRLSVNTETARKMMKTNKKNALEIQSIEFVQILDDSFKLTSSITRVSEFSFTFVPAPVSIWIYLLSGILGLIILFLLILLLIKCGFFERPVKMKAELHAMVPPEEPQNWARWEYSQVYTPN